MEEEKKPEWITDEQWAAVPYVSWWENNRRGDRVYQTLVAGNRRGSSTAAEGSVSQGWSKSRFLAQLELAAIENGTWIDDISTVADKSKRLKGGFENEPYISKDGKSVIKINNFSFLNDNDGQYEHTRDFDYFVDRLNSHNELFPDVAYKIIGIAENSTGEVGVVLEQPYIRDAELATQNEIDNWLTEHGFTKSDKLTSGLPDGWTNGRYEITDAKPQNVLKDKKGNLHFIDADINSVKEESGIRFQIEQEAKPKREDYDNLFVYMEALSKWTTQHARSDHTLTEKHKAREFKNKERDLRAVIRDKGISDSQKIGALTDFIRSSLTESQLTSPDMRQLLTQIKTATSASGDIEQIFDKVYDKIISRQIKNGKSITDELLNIKSTGTNAKGQKEGKKIDNDTRLTIEAVRDYKERITGLRIAQMYYENVLPAKKRILERKRNVKFGKSHKERKIGKIPETVFQNVKPNPYLKLFV